MLLAAPIDHIDTAPWWVQIPVAVALALLGSLLFHLDDKLDNGFLEIMGYLFSCAAIFLTFTALF